jgi:hypothetical protein
VSFSRFLRRISGVSVRRICARNRQHFIPQAVVGHNKKRTSNNQEKNIRMERSTLKFSRLLIPGLILIFEFLPMLSELKISYKIGDGWFEYSFLIIPALVIGAIYHIYDVRFTITNISHRKIDLNITSSLLKVYNKPISQLEYNYLKEKRLKHIFYNIIDNDASLSAKSQLVYFNGLMWTSTADLFILSIFSSIVYFVFGYWILNSDFLLHIGIIYAGFAAFSFCLHVLSIIKHYKLSNDQIEYIETHYRSELAKKIDTVISEMN